MDGARISMAIAYLDPARHRLNLTIRANAPSRPNIFEGTKALGVDCDTGEDRFVVEGDASFYGIEGFFQWLEGRTYKMHIRVLLSKYRSYHRCEDCGGTRFSTDNDTLLYRLAGKNVAEVYGLDISRSLEYFRELSHVGKNKVASMLLQEIENRLEYLERVGLGYLTLDRQSRTLSGGEVQRVDLTTALGSSLVNALYVLDEPSIGLHPRDTSRLMEILERLPTATTRSSSSSTIERSSAGRTTFSISAPRQASAAVGPTSTTSPPRPPAAGPGSRTLSALRTTPLSCSTATSVFLPSGALPGTPAPCTDCPDGA